MNKIKNILSINYKINLRINSEKSPLLYYWLENKGIRLPPEILAYLIIISFLNTIFLGLIAENKNIILFGTLNPIYSSFVLIFSIVMVEILIKVKKIKINSNLFLILPLTKIEFVFIKLMTHFLSLRLWNFMSFVILYLVFSKTYNYPIFNIQNIINIIYFFNIFIIFFAISLYLIDKAEGLFIGLNIMVSRVLRIFFFLSLVILIKQSGLNNNYTIVSDNYFMIALMNMIKFTILSLLSLLISILLCSYKKR
jgi:hypothetical protein